MGWPNGSKDETPDSSSSSGPKPSSSDDDSGDSRDMKWEMSRESETSEDNAVTVSVHPTTGGQFTVQVTITDSVDTLKKVVSHKLKVPKERICLLYRDRLLREGTLNDNLVVEGAKIILLPSVEAGLLTLRPEQSVMQALESLNDSQVNDFLSGKAPLNLTMRLGDYMMIIQLQLSPGSSSSIRSACAAGQAAAAAAESPSSSSSSSSSSSAAGSSSSSSASSSSQPCDLATRSQQPLGAGTGLKHGVASTCHGNKSGASAAAGSSTEPETCRVEPQPGPECHASHHSTPTTQASDGNQASSEQPHNRAAPQKPYRVSLDTVALAEASRNLTQTLRQFSSEVFKTAASQGSRSGHIRLPSSRRVPDCCSSREPGGSARNPEPEAETKKEQPAEDHSQPSTSRGANSQNDSCSSSSAAASAAPTTEEAGSDGSGKASSSSGACSSNSSSSPNSNTSSSSSSGSNPSSSSGRDSSKHRRHGAVIEKMRHHGCGVYSGTFSGTLNPSLQDTQGRPWPGIATIIHILNDLLCANPRHGSFCNHKRKSSQDAPATTSCEPTPAKREKRQSDEAEERERRLSDAERTAVENATTRSKVEALREYLAARKERRKARRNGEPYSVQLDDKMHQESSMSGFKWSLDAVDPTGSSSAAGNGGCETPLPSPSFPAARNDSSPGTPTSTTSEMMNVEGQSLSTWTAESEAAEVAAAAAGDDDQQSGDSVGAPVIA